MMKNYILQNKQFLEDYEKLKSVSLNPERHTAKNAHAHTEMVRERVAYLAEKNDCTPEETDMLACLALVHDIGKIDGTSYPSASVDLLPKYGFDTENIARHEHMAQLVKYHDTSLSWYNSVRRGDAPSFRAWDRMARKLDIWLLVIFMIADRIDCPGGWGLNDATVWFIDEANKRGYLGRRLLFDEEYYWNAE